jgi:hypothetical protein
MEYEIWDIPRRPSDGPQDFGLQPLYDLSMGRLGAAPELNAIRPYRLSTHLYRSSLLARVSCDLRPRSQYRLRNLRSKWRRFDLTWVLQVRRWSMCSSRYFTLVRTGNCTSFIVTRGKTARVVVNVTWEDFSWLILILHVSNHSCRRSRWVWRCWDATSWSEWVASSPVSSEKVAMVVWSVVGRSAVKTRYSRGPRTLFYKTKSFPISPS